MSWARETRAFGTVSPTSGRAIPSRFAAMGGSSMRSRGGRRSVADPSKSDSHVSRHRPDIDRYPHKYTGVPSTRTRPPDSFLAHPELDGRGSPDEWNPADGRRPEARGASRPN